MFVFDISGDSGWGRSYGQIESGKIHPAIEIMHKDLAAAVYGIQVSWLVNIAYMFPGFPDPSKPLKDHCRRMLQEREQEQEQEQEKEKELDVLSFLEKGDACAKKETLLSDLRLLTVCRYS